MWFVRDRRGVAALELAIVAPFLLLVAAAGFDLVQMFRTQLRVDNAATQLGQIVSRCNVITAPGDTDNFWDLVNAVLDGAGTVTAPTGSGAAVVTAVYRVSNANRVAWQRRTGNPNYLSSVGTATGAATIAERFVVPSGQTLIVSEVILRSNTWVLSEQVFGDLIPRTLRGVSLFMTRVADAPSIQAQPTTSNTPNCTA